MKKKFFGCIYIISVCFISSNSLAGERVYTSGEIVDKKGNLTKVEKFMDRCQSQGASSSSKFYDWGVSGKYKGKQVRLKYPEFSRLDMLGNKVIRITNKAGKEFMLEQAHLGCNQIRFQYLDEISMEVKTQKLYSEKIVSVSIDNNIGRMKFNPTTSNYYPGDYLFDPKTGEKLIWKSPTD